MASWAMQPFGRAFYATQAPRLSVVDPQACARRKQHPERRDDPHEARLAVGGVEHDHHQNQVGPVLVDNALSTIAHCSWAEPGGVSQRVTQSPCLSLPIP